MTFELTSIKEKIDKTVELAYMPLTTSDFFRSLRIRTRKGKDQVRQYLEELSTSGYIKYEAVRGLKEKVIFPNLNAKIQKEVEFEGRLFKNNREDILIFVGYADIELIGKISRVIGFRGNAEGFQRMKQRSWVLELSRVLGKSRAFLFTSIVLYFEQMDNEQISYDAGKSKLVIKTGDIHYEQDKPGLIVDGQQRCHAYHELVISGKNNVDYLAVPIVAILGIPKGKKKMEFLKELFINANKSKPLPKSLIDQLLATMESIDDRTIVESSKKGGQFARLIKDADEKEGSPLYNLISFDYKEDPSKYPFNFRVAQMQLKFLYERLKDYSTRKIISDTHLLDIYLDIYNAIKKRYPEIYEFVLDDVRAIGPLFIFIVKTMSTEDLYSSNRLDRFVERLDRISHFIELVPIRGQRRKWEDIGEWNPEKLESRSAIMIEKAGNELLDIYIEVIRNEEGGQ